MHSHTHRQAVIHDFVITENYYCVVGDVCYHHHHHHLHLTFITLPSHLTAQVLPPVSVNYLSLLTALVGMDAIFVNAFSPDTKGRTLVNLIPRSCAAPNVYQHEVRCELDSSLQPVHHACAHEVTSPSGVTHVVLWTGGFRDGYTWGNEFGYALDSDHFDPRRQNAGRTDQLQDMVTITIPVPPPGAPASDEVTTLKCEHVRETQDLALDFLEVCRTVLTIILATTALLFITSTFALNLRHVLHLGSRPQPSLAKP